MAARSRGSTWLSKGLRARRMFFEHLEPRQLLSLTHLYTFNDGLANDWIGNAHADLFNGATITGGQLVLSNAGVSSGQSSTVQYARLPADVLSDTDATVEVWFTATDLPDWTRVFDIGNQSGTNGSSYLFFSPQTSFDDSRGVLSPNGQANEVIASGSTTDDGIEHMAAIVVDTATDSLRLYLDGSEIAVSPLNGASGASINDVLAYVGRSLYNSDPGFTGSINELRIFDEAVTANEIAIHAELGPSNLTQSSLLRQMEDLNRGIIALRRSSTQVYVGWRLLGTDPSDIAFNLYRSTNGGEPVKLNATPITQTTDFVDSAATLSLSTSYFVRPVLDGIELDPSESFTLSANAPTRQYISVPLQRPAGGTTPVGGNYTYNANDTSVGDLDGDGDYELIVQWEPSNAQDNSNSGYTGNVYIDAYDFDGQGNSTHLWRIDLGRNIRAGAHYTQFLVYDLDGDGEAEVVMKTAEATVDGVGTVIGNPDADYRNSAGYILSGPEYLTVFDGLTGAIVHSIPFEPFRGSVSSWGDNYGNRVDRFQATIAYLDGVHPSIVWGRGYAGPQSGFSARNEVAAYDYVDGQLTVRWVYRAATNGQDPGYVGSSAHSITVGDVDGDGKDEVITGAAAIDDDGTLLYNTGLGHGDALHLTDMNLSRPGLEVFMPHEGTGGNGHIGASLRDARTGQLIAGPTVTQNTNGSWPDVGRGAAMDIDPNHPGYEFWDSYHGSIYNSQGSPIYNKPSNMHINFGVWWDADLLRETLDGTTISDWNYTTAGRVNLVSSGSSGINSTSGLSSNNGSKANPALSGDILGDWREEVIWRNNTNTELRIYSTTIAATNRIYTLMHDPQYRQAIAWQNSGYNQPPHPSFFLGAGMDAPPTPNIFIATALQGDYNNDGVVDAADYVVWRKSLGSMNSPSVDGDYDGIIGQGDYNVWRSNYGAVAAPIGTGSGSGQIALNSVEIQASPAAGSLALVSGPQFDFISAGSSPLSMDSSSRSTALRTFTPFAPAPRQDLLLLATQHVVAARSSDARLVSRIDAARRQDVVGTEPLDAAFALFEPLRAAL